MSDIVQRVRSRSFHAHGQPEHFGAWRGGNLRVPSVCLRHWVTLPQKAASDAASKSNDPGATASNATPIEFFHLRSNDLQAGSRSASSTSGKAAG